MDRRTVLAVGIYAALVLSPATPLYLPLFSGRDESWALLVLLAAAHVGLGAAVRRQWVLVLPVALAIAGFFAGGAEGLAWMAIVLGAPAAVALTALGSAIGRAFERRSDVIAVACGVVAVLPAAWAAVETLRRGPPLPASAQRRLPTEISLGNLCPGTETPGNVERDVGRRAEEQLADMEANGPNCAPDLERRLRAAM
jgi:hypothetical protein